MTVELERAVAAKVRRGRVVHPRRNPGRELYRAVVRRNNPVQIENLSDQQLLAVVMPSEAAASIAAYLEPHGGLRAFGKLGENGPRALLHVTGVDEATAARVLVLWEISARISEPYRT